MRTWTTRRLVFVRPQTLRLSPTNAQVAEYIDYNSDEFSQWEPGFTLGGPIMRDRLWFFASYQPQLRSIDRTTTFALDDSTRTFNRKDRQHFSSNNLRFQAGSRTTGRFAFNASPGLREGLLPAPAGSDDPNVSFGIDRETPNYSVSGNLDFVANNKLFFGVRGGYYMSDIHDKNVHQGTRFLFNGTTNIGLAGISYMWSRCGATTPA
ncbi:MAG TPA: hypothetical protein VK886_10330 [Vicinamibacterales bacterium]|nr:hypothetical protein [Vicinamibacterales bacterium]